MKAENRWALLLIVAVGFAAYGAALFGDFVFDDRHAVRDNTALFSLANVPRFFVDVSCFSSLDMNMYRPILLTSYALDGAVAGTHAWMFKLTNIAVHLATGWLLFSLMLALGKRRNLALAASLIFVAHPLASEAVNTISARSNLLMVLALVAGMRCHVAATAGSKIALIGLPLLGAIACGSKEPGVILPGLLLALELVHFLRTPSPRRLDLGGAALRVLPALFVALGYVLLRQHLLNENAFALNEWSGGHNLHTGYGRDMSTQLCGMVLLVPRVLAQMVVPIGMTMDPEFELTGEWGQLRVVAGAGLIIATVGAGLCAPRRRALVLVGSCLAWGVALPWILKPLNHPFLEHRLYGVLCGSAIVLGGAMRFESRRAWTVFGVVLAMFCVLSAQRSLEFRSEEQLWRLEQERNPDSVVAMAGLAFCAMKSNRNEQAQHYLQEILRHQPEHFMARRNLANVELALGDRGSPCVALHHANRLAAMAPKNPFCHLLRSRALTAIGQRTRESERFDEAVRAALHVLKIASPKGLVYRTAAQARFVQGDVPGAIRLLDASVSRGLDHHSVLLQRGEFLARLGRHREAQADLERARQQDPFAPEVVRALQQWDRGRWGMPPR